MNNTLDELMQNVTTPELLDLIRTVLDEIEGRLMNGAE
jgi:hypothetical protein